MEIKKVKDANRKFYNIAADVYEEVDGRRGNDISGWLDDKIRELAAVVPTGERLLDIGCGTGFVLKKVNSCFSLRVGIDISFQVLKHAQKYTHHICNADNDFLPFKDNQFDAVTCLAVLHHMPNHEQLIKEIFRVLKPGGVFYSDHDLDIRFNRIFKIPLYFFRKIKDARGRYLNACPDLTEELYDCSEIHEEGIEVNMLKGYLQKCGFSGSIFFYHWAGLGKIFNIIQKVYGERRSFPRGFAPSFSITAIK